MPDAEESDSSSSSERESTMLRAALAADVAARPSAVSIDEDEGTARVLVADDDPATLALIASTLRASGYEVETAPDGQAAVERVARGGIDVVLLDAVMPRLSGFDACRTIRGLGDDFVPVALAFAKTDPKSRIEALKIGASDYLSKPIDPAALRKLAAELLADRPQVPPNRLLAVARAERAPVADAPAIQVAIGTTMKEVEREVIARTLDAHRWNKNRTARVLGISRRSLYNKLERYAITKPVPEEIGGPPAPPAPHRERLPEAPPPPVFESMPVARLGG